MGVKVREKDKGSGVFWVFINHKGRRSSKRVGDKNAAKEVAKKIQAALVLGKPIDTEERKIVPTLRDYFTLFKESYLAGAAVRFNTQRIYKNNFEIFIRLIMERIQAVFQKFLPIPIYNNAAHH